MSMTPNSVSHSADQLKTLPYSFANAAPAAGTSCSSSASDLPSVLNTADAAAVLNRRPQTLRKWASLGIGPIRPVRIGGRLAWKVSDLALLLSGGV